MSLKSADIKLNEYELEKLVELLTDTHRQLQTIAGWSRDIYIEIMEVCSEEEYGNARAKLDAIEFTADNLAIALDCVLGLNIEHGQMMKLREMAYKIKEAREIGNRG